MWREREGTHQLGDVIVFRLVVPSFFLLRWRIGSLAALLCLYQAACGSFGPFGGGSSEAKKAHFWRQIRPPRALSAAVGKNQNPKFHPPAAFLPRLAPCGPLQQVAGASSRWKEGRTEKRKG